MSDVLTAFKEKYPVYADVPDDKLAAAIGDKYPVYLKHQDFHDEWAAAKTKTVTLDPVQQEQMRTGVPDPSKETLESWLYRQPPQPTETIGAITGWESLKFNTRRILEKVFPGMAEKGSPSPVDVVTQSAMIAPVGMPERLGKLVMGYFAAQTAAQQPAIYRQIRQELSSGNYTEAQKTAVEDALQLFIVGASGMAMRGGKPEAEPFQGPIATGRVLQTPKGAKPADIKLPLAPATEQAVKQTLVEQPKPKPAKAKAKSKPAAEPAAAPAPEPEKITAAAFTDEQGQTHYGANHPEILTRLGREVPPAEQRNTPQFGFKTDKRPFITREEAGPIATASGQNLKEFEPQEPVHSDEVAAKPGGEVPLSETQPQTKEPWQQTLKERRDEVIKAHKDFSGESQKESEAWADAPDELGLTLQVRHKINVEQALREGRPVPPEVLADYPDLKTNKGLPVKTSPEPSPVPAVAESKPVEQKPPVQPATAQGVPKQPISQTKPEMSVHEKEQILGEQVRDQILNAPSFPKLLAAVKSFHKSLHGTISEEWLADRMKEPWDFLSEHSGVMNAKSARAKTLQRLADAVIKEAGLPMMKPGKWRGMEYRIDWDKISEKQATTASGPGMVGMGGAAKGEVETGAGADIYGIAARVRAERAKSGQVGEVGPGQGISAPDSVERGRQLIAGGSNPESALANFEKTKRLSADDMAVVRAHGEQLALAARNIESKFGTESQEFVMAQKALTDWDTRTKPMQTEWHKMGEAQQGETDIDTGTFSGLSRAFTADTGREFNPAQAQTAKQLAANVTKATEAADAAKAKLIAEVSKEPKLDPLVQKIVDKLRATAHTMRDNALERIRARQAAGQMFSGPLNPEQLDDLAAVGFSHLMDGAAAGLEWGNRMVETFGEKVIPYLDQIWERTKAILDEQGNRMADKKTAPKVKVATQKAPMAIADARRMMAGYKPGSVFTPEQVKAVWNRAKAELDKGTTDFDDLVNKLGIDLGMKANDVRRALTQPKGAKRMTDEMYRRMSEQRRVIGQAKVWLKNQQYPGWLRFSRSIPRLFFSAKVAGHGTVAFGTHAPALAFNPASWNIYFPNFLRMFKMVGSPATHERMMQDLIRDPNFINARRAGLANDPFRYQDDYQNPAIQQYFGRFTGMGNRGFDALKLLRQDRFNQLWDGLPEQLQNPDMAKLLADNVNHATGVIKTRTPTGLSTALFAPKLEGSRWAFLFGDPAKAAKVVANWKNETPETRQFALSEIKQKAAMAGTYFSLLALNQGILSAMNSKQKVNFTDPKHGDFLEFKVAGYNIGIASGMLRTIRFLSEMYRMSTQKRSKIESLESRGTEMGTAITQYGRTRLSPFAGTVFDLVSQSDYMGKPLPYSSDRVPAWLKARGESRYTYPEYITRTVAPIPFEEAITEVWKHQGMNDNQVKVWLKALSTVAVTGGTGVRMTEDKPHK